MAITSNGAALKYFEFPEYDIKSSIIKSGCSKCKTERNKTYCTCTESNRQTKDYSLLDFVFFQVSDSIYSKTKLRRHLLHQLGSEGFLVRDQIKEIVNCFQQTCLKTKQKECSYISPMHQIFLCKCKWVLLNPATLPCGHTMCKECADEKMFCSTCGYTLDSPSAPNLFLVELLESWFPNEYIGTRHKRDANELYKSKDYELALNEINLALDLIKDDSYAYNIRAKIYIEMKEYKLALKDANRSYKINQENGNTQFIRGTCFSHLGNLNGAIDAFQLCLELEPEDMALSNAVINKLDEILSLSDTSDKISDKEISESNSDCSDDEKNTKEDHSTEASSEKKEPLVYPCLSMDSSNIKNPPLGIEKTSHEKCNSINESENEKKDQSCSSKTLSNLSVTNSNINSKEVSCTEEPKPTEKVHGVPQRLIKEDEFECKLCYELLYKPVTTSCGHVFCKNCLLRSLDHNPTCPVCRMSLSNFLGNPMKPVTFIIEEILEIFFTMEFNKRKEKYLEKMERLSRVGIDENVEIPIFVCSIAFPYVKCPLHIFEPKYRLMIRECLESGSQRFGMCIPQSGGETYSDVGTICELNKVQTLPDGRYIINAVAGQRFLVQEKISIDSMNYAKVKYFEDEPEDLNHEQFLMTSRRIYNDLSLYVNSLNTAEQDCIFNALGMLPEYENECQRFKHGVPWVWWGLAALPLNFPAKLVLLRSKCVSERMLSLERFLRFLTKMQSNVQPPASQSNS